MDAWQQLLAHYVPGRVPRVLLAHKADLFSSRQAQCVVNDRLLGAYKCEIVVTTPTGRLNLTHATCTHTPQHRGLQARCRADRLVLHGGPRVLWGLRRCAQRQGD